MTKFQHYIGIDYSGANDSFTPIPGIAVAACSNLSQNIQIIKSVPKWSRQSLAQWIIQEINTKDKVIIGIDHAFSLPEIYFDRFKIAKNWNDLLLDFEINFPSHKKDVWIDHLRNKKLKTKNPPSVISELIGMRIYHNDFWPREQRLRLTDKIAKSKSVFHFDAQGTVGKSTFAGLPWLGCIRNQIPKDKLHFWPFDGWEIPHGKSAIVEVYPRLWNRTTPKNPSHSQDQHDAYSVAKWLAETDRAGKLDNYLIMPDLSDSDRNIANLEGWILGAMVNFPY